MANKETLLLIDGSNLAHRAYQKFKNLRSRDGQYTGLIYGFLRLLRSYLVKFDPTSVIITIDSRQSKESNFRNKLLGSYKKHREYHLGMDYDDFNEQIDVLRKMLKYLNIPVVYDSKGLGHESDDYIGYYAQAFPGKVIIISSDKDFCQLINKRVKVFNPFKEVIIHEKTCKGIMGYSPQECVDYLCLIGDKSDDIPGYKGIGPIKAREFLDKFQSIESFLADESLEYKGIDRDGLKDLYKRNKLLIDILVALKTYPPKRIPITYYKKNLINKDKLKVLFKQYTLQSFLINDFLEPFHKIQVWQKD